MKIGAMINGQNFFEGKNVADFYDPEIVAKLDALEAEEDQILKL